MGHVRDDRGRLCCDACGAAPARLVRCPSGWCQGWDLCATCRKSPTVREKVRESHATCAASSERYRAECAERDRRLAAGESLRVAALGRGGLVRVIFRDARGIETGADMTPGVYDEIPLGQAASLDDYRACARMAGAPEPTDAPAILYDRSGTEG